MAGRVTWEPTWRPRVTVDEVSVSQPQIPGYGLNSLQLSLEIVNIFCFHCDHHPKRRRYPLPVVHHLVIS